MIADSLKEAASRGSRKAFRRIIVILVLAMMLSCLDRINIGFADLTMAGDLGLNATTFGFANSVFYMAFAVFEIPSTLALARLGARIWIPRIMISWGIASCLTLFALGPHSLYFVRFFVGAAEAGLLPGVILYLSFWFSPRDRARANAIFVMGLPLAMVIGAPISGAILQLNGFLGMAGWRWLFLLEGIPSIALGILAYFFLIDRPSKAPWLTEEEKVGMEAVLAEEAHGRGASAGHSRFHWRDLTRSNVLRFACVYFCSTVGSNTFSIWLPLVVRDLMHHTNRLFFVGAISATVPLFAVIAVPLWSWSSDRRNERLIHLVVSLTVGLLGWVIVAVAPNAIMKLAGLTMACIGAWSFVPIFWVYAVSHMTPTVRPVAISIITISGLFASILSPTVVGILRDMTHGFTAGCWYVAVLNFIGLGLLAIKCTRARELPSQHNAQLGPSTQSTR